MRPITTLAASVLLSGPIAALSPAIGGPSNYTFTTINPPGPTIGFAVGNNNQGQIVGNYQDNNGVIHGFLDTGGNFTTIDPPGFTGSTPIDINNRGEILINAGSSNFIYARGAFTPITLPGLPFGFNDQDQIVGDNGDGRGFLYSRGNTTFIDAKGSSIVQGALVSTVPFAINNSGQIVGVYRDSTGFHSFLDEGGMFSTIAAPNTSFTLAFGINDRGQIVGGADDHGFLDTRGDFALFDMPGADFTGPQAINDQGQIVGFDSINGSFGIFLATDPPGDPVPEPSSLAILAMGLIGVGLIAPAKTRIAALLPIVF